MINAIKKLLKNKYRVFIISITILFLTFYGLNTDKIKFLTDGSIYKQNKLTPVTRIPIQDDKELIKYNKIACIILSWNISTFVISKIKRINKKIKIIYT